MKKIVTAIFLLSLFSNTVRSQNAAACNAAQPVCNNPNFNFTAGSGFNQGVPTTLNISNPGTNPQGINSGCLLSGGPGPQWLMITASSNGLLGFSFGASGSANPQAGYYDWAMWPYSPTACNGIFANTLPPAACNWNATSMGGTGMGTVPTGGNPGNFQPSLNVTAGQQFIICISNYSGVNTPVSFSTTGTANLSCNPYIVASQTICAGSSAVLTGTTNLTSAQYTLVPGPMISGTGIFNVSPAATTAYTITATGTDPNLGTSQTRTTTATVTVLNPSVTANSASVICQGATCNLTATATGTIAYSWTGPNGFTSASQNPVIANAQPSSTGVYSVQAASSNGTLVCYAGNTTTLTVVPISSISVCPPIVICENDAIALTANSLGASSYTWNGPGFGSASQNPGISNAMPSNSGNYSVTAFFIGGPLTCSTTNVVNVTVNPKVNFTLAPIPNICHNQTVVVPAPAGATSYTWTGPNGYLANTQNLNIPNAVMAQSGVYTCSISLNSCVTSNSVNVDILSPLSFSVVPANRTICMGDTVHLNTQVTGCSGVYSYSWTPSTGLLLASGTSVIGSPSVSTVYYIIANDAACPTVTISANVIVFVNPLPVPNTYASKVEGCTPLCVDLASGSAPNSVNTYWDFGHGLAAGGDSITYCFNNPGTYSLTVSLTDVNGCKSKTKLPFTITAYPHPEPDFGWDPGNPSLIENVVNFVSSYNHGPITNYFWYFHDTLSATGNTSTVKNPIHEFSGIGNFPVTLVETNTYGCTDTLTKVVTINEDFTMYIPNTFTPNGDGLNDQFLPKGMGFRAESFEMLIYDRWGNLIYRTNDATKGWDGTVKGSIIQNDVYVYKVKCLTGINGARKEFVGHVTLIK